MSDLSSDRDPSPAEYELSEIKCPFCGHGLGESPADRCPFCGEAIDVAPVSRSGGPLPQATPGSVPTALDTGGPIPPEWELECTKCGYNLTGLTSRVCPECGLAFKPRRTWEANRRPKSWFRPNTGEAASAAGEAPPRPGPVRAPGPTVFDPGGAIPPEWNLSCTKCGYSLTGLTSRVCPECGLAFKPREMWEANRYGKVRILPTISPDLPQSDEGPTRPAEMRLPAPTVIDLGGEIPAEWHLHCTKCGYGLTGLSSRRCPECGQPFKPRQTWEANRRPKYLSVPISKEELIVGLVGGGIAALLCWGGGPFSFLVPLTFAVFLILSCL